MGVGPRFIGDVELPWPEGTHAGPDFWSVGPAGRPAAWTLSALSATHLFFSHVVLKSACAGVGLDPVALYWAEAGLDRRDAPYALDTGATMFEGPAPPEDRIVYACSSHLAPGLVRFLDRFSGTLRGQVWDSVRQNVHVRDHRLVSTLTLMPPNAPRVAVALYGLSGPSGVYHWLPPKDLWTDNPRLAFRDKKLDPMPHKFRLPFRRRDST